MSIQHQLQREIMRVGELLGEDVSVLFFFSTSLMNWGHRQFKKEEWVRNSFSAAQQKTEDFSFQLQQF